MIENEFYSYTRLPELIKWFKENFNKTSDKRFIIRIFIFKDLSIGFKYLRVDVDINVTGDFWFEYFKIYSRELPIDDMVINCKLLGFVVENKNIIDYEESIFEQNKHLIVASELNLL